MTGALSDPATQSIGGAWGSAQCIGAVARKYRVGVIVTGAISRSAVTRFFIGNTAERVIDDVQCDVLVVKSAGFCTAVTRRVTRPVLGYPAVPGAGSATTRQLHY